MMEDQQALTNLQAADIADAGDIAVVGIGCRFPGDANDPHSLWTNLRQGLDAIGEVPSDRWSADAHFHPKRGVTGKSATRWGGFVRQIDGFDAEFFGISPREAELMDPQQRLLLEVCWEALEDAGAVPSRLFGTAVGVYVGGFTLDYMLMQLGGAEYRSVQPHTATGSMMTLLANRLSYVFGFQGPSLAIDTACSSSLVAVHLACNSLKSGESSLAVAGGVNALLGPAYTIAESRAGMLSPTGRSRAFDARADGYVRGEGAGIVVLKRLQDARADGDHIYAVIRATAVNQDGHSDGLTVPSGEAQQKLIREACRQANIAPAQIDYVEAHGTGTPVGDPIELNAIGSVVGEGRDDAERCLVGSIKTNIGHTEAAAGVAGLIKASLVLARGEVPPHLHLQNVNPKIDMAALKVKAPLALTALPQRDRTRYAAVNSFGFGGTNAHAILAEYPAEDRDAQKKTARGPFSLPLSARHADALAETARRYADALDAGGTLEAVDMADVVWTASARREHHPQRAMVIADSRQDVVRGLRAIAENTPDPAAIVADGYPAIDSNALAFVYSGMGPQWWGMGQSLYSEEPVFRAAVDRLANGFEAIAGWSILKEMMATQAQSRMSGTDVAQPASFILQVALTELLASWGIAPSVVVGHSAGEPAAALVSGALSEADALRVVLHRSRLQHTTSGQGRMLALGLGATEAQAAIDSLADPSLTLAAINSPTAVTVAGAAESIERLETEMTARGVFAKALRVEVPYHSVYMEPLREPLYESLRGIQPRACAVPLYSTVSGRLIDGAELDERYWYRNVRQPVLFCDAIRLIAAVGVRGFVEISAHPVLKSSIEETMAADGRDCLAVPTLSRDRSETTQARRAAATLYCAGIAPDWRRFVGVGAHVDLPKYPWRHESYWHEPSISMSSRRNPPPHPIVARRVPAHLPTWEIDLDRDSLFFLQDHCIEGSVVFPGAGYIETAAFAARELFGDLAIVNFSEVKFERALYLSSDVSVSLNISVEPSTSKFTIASKPYGADEDAWQTHCTGRLLVSNAGDPAPIDVESLRLRCSKEIAVEDCYAHFENLGLEYGPTFRGIVGLYQGEQEALARVEVPQALHAGLERFNIHPALLDLCFQTLAAALPFGQDKSAGVYMPTGVSDGRIIARMPTKLWIHAELTARDPGGLSGDIRMIDDEGNVVLRIDGCRAKALGADAGKFAVTPQRLFEPAWRVMPIATDPDAETGPAVVESGARWLVYAGDEPLAAAVCAEFAACGAQSVRVAASDFDAGDEQAWRDAIAAANRDGMLRGVLHLGETGDEVGGTPGHPRFATRLRDANISTLALLKALAGLNTVDKPRLWLATRAAQRVVDGDSARPLAATLWGLGRVAGHCEHVDLWGGMIDLSAQPERADASRIVVECVSAFGEDQIAYRNGVRYGMRLQDCTDASRLPNPPALRGDASYLITGGLGALGIAVSGWLVQRGARHLVLVGRESLPPRASWAGLPSDHPARVKVDAVIALERMGASVRVESLDVADPAAVKAMVAAIRDEGRPPLRGVIHSAGVAHPRLLTETAESEFMSVFPPKVMGAWNLHEATAGDRLDFFVLFSSVASLVTSMGQGNYAAANAFLDALAHRRRAERLPAVSVNWGPWGDVGMATKLDLISLFNGRGFYPMTAEQGCEALGWLMSDRAAQAIVIGAHWTRVGETSPLGIPAPMLLELIAEESKAGGSERSDAAKADVLELIRAEADEAQRLALAQAHVRDTVCRVLRVDTAKIGDGDNLSNRGLDSMMAIDLKNRIEKSFKVAYAIVDLLKGATIQGIAERIHASLESQRAVDGDSALADIASRLEQLSSEEIEALLADNA